ncbi:MAG: 4'-phosphopantetheinyl transferase superfamily protein [Rhodospirillales bacterium]|nr:4'-phosphopantetheinyl transferase superfamily protein [Rhodospirillales bacterium]
MPAGLQKRQVHVWSWSLEADLLGGEAQAMLSDDETARWQRFVSADLRRRFLVAHAGLRVALGRHLGLDPKGLSFEANEFGKPRLKGGWPGDFNLSHSGGRAVLAVSDEAEVGIDLERVRPIEHLDLGKRYFHPNEVAAIAAPRDLEEQRRAFFLIWTLKEAVVKAIGCGLSIPLESFEVSLAASRPTMVLAPAGTPRTWWLQSTTLGDYCLSLAMPGAVDVGLIHRTM